MNRDPRFFEPMNARPMGKLSKGKLHFETANADFGRKCLPDAPHEVIGSWEFITQTKIGSDVSPYQSMHSAGVEPATLGSEATFLNPKHLRIRALRFL
jgi:hypothetical protein